VVSVRRPSHLSVWKPAKSENQKDSSAATDQGDSLSFGSPLPQRTSRRNSEPQRKKFADGGRCTAHSNEEENKRPREPAPTSCACQNMSGPTNNPCCSELVRQFLHLLETRGVSVLCFDFDGTLTVHPSMAQRASEQCEAMGNGDPSCETDYFELSPTAVEILKQTTRPGTRRWKIFLTTHNTMTDMRSVMLKHLGPAVYGRISGFVRKHEKAADVGTKGKRVHMNRVLQRVNGDAPDAPVEDWVVSAENGNDDDGSNNNDDDNDDAAEDEGHTGRRARVQPEDLILFDDHPDNVRVAVKDGFRAVFVHKSTGLTDDDLRAWMCMNDPGLLLSLSPELQTDPHSGISRLGAPTNGASAVSPLSSAPPASPDSQVLSPQAGQTVSWVAEDEVPDGFRAFLVWHPRLRALTRYLVRKSDLAAAGSPTDALRERGTIVAIYTVPHSGPPAGRHVGPGLAVAETLGLAGTPRRRRV